MRNPAFSISALIAPVRLRAVASGLMIEKVRSIAMISSLKKGWWELRAYIGAIAERQATGRNAPNPGGQSTRENYNNFTNMNLLCTGHPGFVHLLGNRL
jgi:hypothetical protein